MGCSGGWVVLGEVWWNGEMSFIIYHHNEIEV